MEPWIAEDTHNEAVEILYASDRNFHHFGEEQGPDPDPHRFERSDPDLDPHHSKRSDPLSDMHVKGRIRIRTASFWEA